MDATGTVWMVWAGLTSGAGVVLLALYRGGGWRSWRARHLPGTEQETEVVAVGNTLGAGLDISLAARIPNTEIPGCVVTVEDKTLLATLDTSEYGDGAVPPIGVEAAVTFSGGGAQYRFSARVRDARKDTIRPGTWHITLSRPQWLERIQRRRHARTPLHLPATLERAASSNSNLLHFPFHATLLDLSGGGFRADIGGAMGAAHAAQLAETLTPGSLLKIRMPLPALSGSPLFALITACEKRAISGGIGVQLRCEFASLQAWEEDALIQSVFALQKEQIRNRSRFSG